MTDDRAAKKAEELLPWKTFSCETADEETWERLIDGIAAELRKAYRLAKLESEAKESSWNHINLLEAEIAHLRAELAKVKP